MAKFTRMGTSISIEPLLNFDRIIANKPTQVMILRNNRFKNSPYIALDKQRKNRAYIITKAHLPNENFAFSRETSHKSSRAPLRFIFSLIPCLPFLAIQGFNFRNHAVLILVSIASTAVIMKLLQNPRLWKRVINLFKGTRKCVEVKPEEIKKTPVAPNPKLWRLASDDLLITLDAYKFEYFVYNMCMLLAWWVISRLVSFFRRFYSKNSRK